MTAPRPSKPPRLPVFVVSHLIYLPVCCKRIDKLRHSEYCQVESVQMKEHHGMVCTSQWICIIVTIVTWHAALSRFSGLFFPGERRLTDVVPTSKAGNLVSWDVCIKHRGHNLQRIRGYIGLLIQFPCIVLKSYFIGLLSLHGCNTWCQLNQCFPEFINVVRPSDLEARQSEPLRHCRRRRFWLEGCSHPICLVAQLCLGHLGKGKANAIWEALAALKTSLPLNKKQLCSSHTGNRRWLYCPNWIRTKILSDSTCIHASWKRGLEAMLMYVC